MVKTASTKKIHRFLCVFMFWVRYKSGHKKGQKENHFLPETVTYGYRAL